LKHTTCQSIFACAVSAVKAAALSFGILLSTSTLAQTSDVEQLSLAREAIAKQDWRTAELLLVPLSQKQSQAQNPFVFYELAQVYENTRRPDAAKKIYQELTTSPDLIQRQPTIVVRAPYASRLLSLISLSQSKLNSIEARQAAASPLPETPPPKPATTPLPEVVTPRAVVASASPAVVLPPITTTTIAAIAPPAQSQEALVAGAVSVALKNWADAWARKDLPKYCESYVDQYRGEFPTPDAWKKQRISKITKPKTILLDIKNVAMTPLTSSTVQVRFQQTYVSDIVKETSTKTLIFASRGGRWLIESESIR
jgi:hypothetical protein